MNDCDVWVMDYDVEEEDDGRRVGRLRAGVIGHERLGRGRRVVDVDPLAVFAFRPSSSADSSRSRCRR